MEQEGRETQSGELDRGESRLHVAMQAGTRSAPKTRDQNRWALGLGSRLRE